MLGAPAPPSCQHKGCLEICSLTQLPDSASIQLWNTKEHGLTFQGQSHFKQNWPVPMKAYMPIALHKSVMSYHQTTWSPSHSFANFFPIPLPCECSFLLKSLKQALTKVNLLLSALSKILAEIKLLQLSENPNQQLQKEHQRLVGVSHHDFYILVHGLSYSLVNSVSKYSRSSKARKRWDVPSNKFLRGWRCALRVWFSLILFLALVKEPSEWQIYAHEHS